MANRQMRPATLIFGHDGRRGHLRPPPSLRLAPLQVVAERRGKPLGPVILPRHAPSLNLTPILDNPPHLVSRPPSAHKAEVLP